MFLCTAEARQRRTAAAEKKNSGLMPYALFLQSKIRFFTTERWRRLRAVALAANHSLLRTITARCASPLLHGPYYWLHHGALRRYCMVRTSLQPQPLRCGGRLHGAVAGCTKHLCKPLHKPLCMIFGLAK